MNRSLPTQSGLVQRLGDFATLPEALDYAALGQSGLCFYDGRLELVAALPYRRLRDEARVLAGRLLATGLEPGERVAIVADTNQNVVTAFCACQYAGLIPALVPMPSAFGGRDAYASHIRRLVAAARAAALFVPQALEEWLTPVAEVEKLRAFGTIAALVETGLDVVPELATPQPDAVAYLQFSSGSTRFPAGVAVTQRALMANVQAILRHGLQVRPEDRAVSWLPLYHDMGLVGFLLASIAGQVTVDLLPPQEFARRPHLWLRLLSANRGTLSFSPSFGYELCARRARGRSTDTPPWDLSAWRVAGIGGDMIRPSVLARFANGFADQGFRPDAFLPSYGMAEATLAISFAPLGQGVVTDTVDLDQLEQSGLASPAADTSRRVRGFALCGVPLPGTDIEIRDVAGGSLPDRRVGRIQVRGPGLMQGYDGRPEDSAVALSPDGWLDTGDLGYSVGGQIVITGRAKDLIVVNGRNVWPQDLEWTVEQSVPAVRSGDAAAFAVDEDGVEHVVVLLETRGAPDAATREHLIAEIAGALRARHGLEARVVLVAPGSLPHTSSGKLSRTLARTLYQRGALAGGAEVLSAVS